MLAYVFFHRATPKVEVAAYEAALRYFHSALASAAPQGFVSSTTYRTEDGYADWYLVESSAALDVLNEAAVSGARAASHDTLARASTDAAGKLLTLVSGIPPGGPGVEIRFSKPAGMSYRDLYGKLKPWTGRPDVSLWRRMMVLGPPPEFCLVSPLEVALPEDLRPKALRREAI